MSDLFEAMMDAVRANDAAVGAPAAAVKVAAAVAIGRIAPLEAIVRDLADRGAPPSYDEETCWYCDTVIAYKTITASDHDPECTWRQAVEWVAAHPADP